MVQGIGDLQWHRQTTHCIVSHCPSTVHGSALIDTAVHNNIVLGIAMHGTLVYSTTMHCNGVCGKAVHSSSVNSAAVHSAAVHSAAVHSAAVHSAAVHSAARNCCWLPSTVSPELHSVIFACKKSDILSSCGGNGKSLVSSYIGLGQPRLIHV